MQANGIKYKTKAAAECEIFLHLKECSVAFVPPLAERVNIDEYAKKIYKRSITFEAWSGKLLVGLIAAYFDEGGSRSVFITNVSVLGKFTGQGVATKLLDMCAEYAKNNGFPELRLEVHKDNTPAVRFYTKHGFENHEIRMDMLLMKRRMP